MSLIPIIEDYKTISDTIHGDIDISNIAIRIIDTPQFQRLKDLEQLGTCSSAFPSGTHTRKAHSIGTYYLTGRILKRIKETTTPEDMHKYLCMIPELQEYLKTTYDKNLYVLDDYIIELVKIGGLLHDVGHGPFSHVFDNFITTVHIIDHPEIEHEFRSCMITEDIIKQDKQLSKLIPPEHVQFIKQTINPPDSYQSFLYQIVSNGINGIDVDKYDYLERDSYVLGFKHSIDTKRFINDIKVKQNIICFSHRTLNDITNLFDARYKLHKQFYCHHAVVSYELMLHRLMTLMDPILNISAAIFDVAKFTKLTDKYITNLLVYMHDNLHLFPGKTYNLQEAYTLHNRMITRQNYKLVSELVCELDKKDEVMAQLKELYSEKNHLIFSRNIGLISGNKKNPLDSIYIFDKHNNDEITLVKKEEFSKLLSKTYQECLIMVFNTF